MIKRRNKKGAIGATLTWIVAIFIILFILIVFLVLVAALGFFKGGIEIKSEDLGENKLILTQNLFRFLNSPVGNDGTVYDLISKADAVEGQEERKEIFEQEAEKFLQESFPVGYKDYWRVWVRVYKADEEIGQYYISSISSDYEVSNFFRGESGGISCEPDRTNTFFVSIFVAPDKKLAICANHW